MASEIENEVPLVASILLACKAFIILLSESPLMSLLVELIEKMLLLVGAPDSFVPSAVDTSRSVVVISLTLLSYYLFFGKRHSRKRHRLATELQMAQEKLHYLQEQVLKESDSTNEVRIFLDGAFDMMHYGHMNAFRLAKSLGTHLVVGVNSDKSITSCKGKPLMNDDERLTMVSACKFVDEVVPDCPYIMNKEYLDYVIEKYSIDYVVHGDDPCFVDGKDVYAAAKAAGKFRTIPRTEGVSTTDIVGRMLLLTKEHHLHGSLGSQSKFLTTSRMLKLFSADVQPPTKDIRVIYIDGAWDLFHPGHVAILKAAKSRGDYLIVGIHGDGVVNRQMGANFPLLNLHERVLSVLGCRFVDDVLIDAPYTVTQEMIASLNISEVVHGTVYDDIGSNRNDGSRYKEANDAGLLSVLQSPCDFRLENIVHRIQDNQEMFQARFKRKSEAENVHYKEKYGQNSGNNTTNKTDK
mmetsp:Transcript_3095/g.7268  ORF Transcript_3095/g.7268 Transcript_3095/m.7268 type:complete len:466 (+) Transcript_3095:92-1489(+)